METLNSTISGTIKKNDFKKALLTFNLENHAVLNIDLIVSDVFKDQVSLDRSEIRIEMSSNQTVQDSVTAEPVQDQIMMQLESIPTSSITLRDLNKAVAAVKIQNEI